MEGKFTAIQELNECIFGFCNNTKTSVVRCVRAGGVIRWESCGLNCQVP